MLSVELHAHSEASHDGRDPVESLVEQADRVGLDGLAVTDHDTIDASLQAAKLAEKKGMVGIPGIEISTKVGHVLGLGITDRVKPGLSFQETLRQIHSQDGIAVLPHPFQEYRHGVGAHISKEEMAMADAIEIYNSRTLFGIRNLEAKWYAEAYGLPMTAGSDAHIAKMVGQAKTIVNTTDRSVEGVVNAIKDGKTEIDARRTPWHISFRQAAGGIRRRVKRRVKKLRR